MLALRERGLLGPTILGAFLVCAAGVLAYVMRERPRPLELALLLVLGGVYAAMIRHLPVLQERIHLIEYGLVAALVWSALRQRWGNGSGWRQPALGALLLTTAAGWGDELVQLV